jgi:hypothetical protein
MGRGPSFGSRAVSAEPDVFVALKVLERFALSAPPLRDEQIGRIEEKIMGALATAEAGTVLDLERESPGQLSRELAIVVSAPDVEVDAARVMQRQLRWRKPLAIATLVFSLLVATSAGLVLASTSSRPGDSIYSLKLAWESFKVRMARPGLEKSRLLMNEAQSHLDELNDPGGLRPAEIVTTADRMIAATASSLKQTTYIRWNNPRIRRLHELSSLTSKELDALSEIKSRVPINMRGQIESDSSAASSLSNQVEQMLGEPATATPVAPTNQSTGSRTSRSISKPHRTSRTSSPPSIDSTSSRNTSDNTPQDPPDSCNFQNGTLCITVPHIPGLPF